MLGHRACRLRRELLTSDTSVTRFDGVRVPTTDHLPVWLNNLADDVTLEDYTAHVRGEQLGNVALRDRYRDPIWIFGVECWTNMVVVRFAGIGCSWV